MTFVCTTIFLSQSWYIWHNAWTVCWVWIFTSLHMFSFSVSCCVVTLKACCVSSPQEAIETFKEALKLKSDFIDAYKSLGQAYRYSIISTICPSVFKELRVPTFPLCLTNNNMLSLCLFFLFPESWGILSQRWRASRKPSCWTRITSSLSSCEAWCCTTTARCKRP